MAEKAFTHSLASWVSSEGLQEIDQWIAKYPPEERQSAVMAALRIVQEAQGHLTQPMMDAVADYLSMPQIAVYEVATFYSMYALEPVGKHVLNVCTNISCQLKNVNNIISHIENRLGIKMGETTPDGQFTLRSVECLGACVNAPVIECDKTYHEHMTPSSVDVLLESCFGTAQVERSSSTSEDVKEGYVDKSPKGSSEQETSHG